MTKRFIELWFPLLQSLMVCLVITSIDQVLAQTGEQATAEPAGTSLGGSLRHSDIALMPEGTTGPPTTMRPLHPTVVAWGNDAISLLDRPESLRQRMEAYRQIGIRRLACNVWMLTATDRVLHDQPEYQDAVCVDIAGGRIVPPWLDSEYRGVRPYWGCTNHPLFRQQVARRAKAGIAAGADLLHLDDHRGTAAAARFAGGCFCDHCMAKFRDWLKQEYSADQRQARGIDKMESFDYRQMVRRAGFTTLESYQRGVYSNKIPLREEFLAFQRQAAAQFVAELGQMASAVAGRDVPVGVNAFNLSPSQLSNAHVADFFANEVEHYGVEETVPPLVYKLGSALGKPVFSTGAGHDWINIGEDESVTRVQRWIATAYSFGHYFMYAQRKWGFSKETGTRWYLTPISTYRPLTQFVSENPQLFDDHHQVAQVGLLYSNRACHENHWEVREVARQLHDANVPFSLVVAGDHQLKFPLTQRQLSKFPLTIVPHSTLLEREQAQLLQRWTGQGKAIPWQGLDDLQQRIQPWITVHNAARVWALPRARKEPASLVIHLLNQDYDAQTDAVRACQDVQLSVHRALLPSTEPLVARLLAPKADSISLQIDADADRIQIRVPRLSLWGVVQIEPK